MPDLVSVRSREDDLPLISVIIPSRNRSAHIGRCLDSIIDAHHHNHRFEVIVVADQCTDDTVQLITRKYPSVQLCETRKRSWVHGSRALGAERACGDFLFCLDDDNVLEEHCLDRLLAAVSDDPTIGVVAPAAVDPRNPGIYDAVGWNVTAFGHVIPLQHGNQVNTSSLAEPIDVDATPNAFLIRRDLAYRALADVAAILPHNWSEALMCHTVRDAGMRATALASAVVTHDRGYTGPLTRLSLETIRDQARSRIVWRKCTRPSLHHALAFWAVNFPLSSLVYLICVARSRHRIRLLSEFAAGVKEGISTARSTEVVSSDRGSFCECNSSNRKSPNRPYASRRG